MYINKVEIALTREEKLDFILEKLLFNRFGNKTVAQLMESRFGNDELNDLFDILVVEQEVKENDSSYTCEFHITERGKEKLSKGGYSGKKRVTIDRYTRNEKKLIKAMNRRMERGKKQTTGMLFLVLIICIAIVVTLYLMSN